RAVRLVLGILVVAEGPALRVEDDGARLRLVVGSEAPQHVEHPVDRAGRLALRALQLGQGVERPVQVRRAVDQQQCSFRICSRHDEAVRHYRRVPLGASQPLVEWKLMRRLLAIALASLAVSAWAQKPPPGLEPLPEPPPPPPMPGPEEPGVRIPVQEADKVEEIRQGGRVVMLKVTPPGGKPYYLMDTSGNGNWMRRDSLDDGVRVPMWPIQTFDRFVGLYTCLRSPAVGVAAQLLGRCAALP